MARKPTGNPPGKPKILWDDAKYREFEILCSMHMTEKIICSFFRIDDQTLNRLLKERYGAGFRNIYEIFRDQGDVSLVQKAYGMAQRGHWGALKLLLMNRLGMAEKVDQKTDVKVQGSVVYKTQWGNLPQKPDGK